MKHINVDTLREAFMLRWEKSNGGRSGHYSKKLEENLEALTQRLQKGNYRPQPKREVLIPKADGKKRPLAISCFEDKMVDWVVAKLLTAIYETQSKTHLATDRGSQQIMP